MTTSEAQSLLSCPVCGSDVMHVPVTGLVSCLNGLKFGPCKWYVRVSPWEVKVRKDTMTLRDKHLAKLRAEVDKRIAEANEATN